MKALIEKRCSTDKEKKAVEAELKNSRAIDIIREILKELEANCIKPGELDSYDTAHWDKLVADKFGQARAYRKMLSILETK